MTGGAGGAGGAGGMGGVGGEGGRERNRQALHPAVLGSVGVAARGDVAVDELETKRHGVDLVLRVAVEDRLRWLQIAQVILPRGLSRDADESLEEIPYESGGRSARDRLALDHLVQDAHWLEAIGQLPPTVSPA